MDLRGGEARLEARAMRIHRRFSLPILLATFAPPGPVIAPRAAANTISPSIGPLDSKEPERRIVGRLLFLAVGRSRARSSIGGIGHECRARWSHGGERCRLAVSFSASGKPGQTRCSPCPPGRLGPCKRRSGFGGDGRSWRTCVDRIRAHQGIWRYGLSDCRKEIFNRASGNDAVAVQSRQRAMVRAGGGRFLVFSEAAGETAR